MHMSNTSLFAISEDLIPPAPIKAAGTSEVDFDGLLPSPLRLHEDLKNGCGGQLWPAGMVLGKYLLRKMGMGELEGRRIVELGAGGGLVGLALALKQVSSSATALDIHITDQLPMFDLMNQNIALNDLSSTVTASIYDWGTPPPSSIPRNPDIILAADCVYFEPAFPLLQSTLKDLITNNENENAVCYFCFKRRRRADLGFVKTARKMFDVEEVMDDPDRKVWEREKVFLYRITKKKT
ncbi:putative methyltransferase-domain-containing protein [Clohesyomyces aquaticus]|uniref:Protein-lysine N-methyltransferase EFM6 n=1 Tax=Clohesyomyces aquaticus TaxID=1231657 RepID=A0A1Y1YBV3_9PLEO|nr:putative methyltransferase-domain-containing protein [Clohesyomyces aquaticus]